LQAIRREEVTMPTYVCLGKLTDKGVAQIKNSPARLDSGRKTLRELGGELKEFYLVTGAHDTVWIATAPDDAVMTKWLLGLCSLGFVRSETMRAFTEVEYRQIIDGLPDPQKSR
jgi:uncharacterized protein with GYD domain